MEAAVSGAAAIQGARALGFFGDSITIGHISPAGSIKDSSPVGHGVTKTECNNYGSRCGNHEIMKVTVKWRIDTAIEVDDYRHGGILPYVLRELLRTA